MTEKGISIRYQAKIFGPFTGATWQDVLEAFAAASGTDPELVTLLHRGTKLTMLSTAAVPESGSCIALASSTAEIDAIRNHPTFRLRDDFAVKRAARTASDGNQSQAAWREFIGSIETLPMFADRDRAHALLVELACDPAVLAVLKAKRYKVGVLREMPPDGKVGVDPVCVLGLNTNRGASISLRLRTDDLLGFRKYDTIRKVLYHELAHNEISEHTNDFYALVSELERIGTAGDYRNTPGRTLGSAVFRREVPDDDDSNEPLRAQRLGGDSQAQQTMSAAEAARQAALRRAGASVPPSDMMRDERCSPEG